MCAPLYKVKAGSRIKLTKPKTNNINLNYNKNLPNLRDQK